MPPDEFGRSNNVITLSPSDRSKLAAVHLALTTDPVREAVVYSLSTKPRKSHIHWERDT